VQGYLEQSNKTSLIFKIFVIFVLFILYLSSLYSYLLFHTLVEIFSICIAFTVFVLTWNSSGYIKNNYLLLIGTAYLFIGVLDLFHFMSYKGMPIFWDYDYYANQIGLATQYLGGITWLISFFFLKKQNHINKYIIFAIYLLLTALILHSVFVSKIFPVCFVDGVGLTPFKIYSEYEICFIFTIAIYVLRRNRDVFDKKVYHYLNWSMIFTILSDLCFTRYASIYGFTNMVGHYFKIFAFYFIYKAIIKNGILESYELILREFKMNEKILSEENEKFRNEAIIDGLTGLFNHRYLYDKLEEEKCRCERYQGTFSIIMLDIDHFKLVNDSFGHLAGDEIIKSIANMIKNHIRVTDIAGRYGGEEFLIILPETKLDSAVVVAEKIRMVAANTVFVHDVKLTVSGGVSEYQGEKVSDLVKSADHKLYTAKKNGRNRIEYE